MTKSNGIRPGEKLLSVNLNENMDFFEDHSD